MQNLASRRLKLINSEFFRIVMYFVNKSTQCPWLASGERDVPSGDALGRQISRQPKAQGRLPNAVRPLENDERPLHIFHPKYDILQGAHFEEVVRMRLTTPLRHVHLCPSASRNRMDTSGGSPDGSNSVSSSS